QEAQDDPGREAGRPRRTLNDVRTPADKGAVDHSLRFNWRERPTVRDCGGGGMGAGTLVWTNLPVPVPPAKAPECCRLSVRLYTPWLSFAVKVIVPWAEVRVKTIRARPTIGSVLCNWTGPRLPSSPVAFSAMAG